MSKQIVDLVEKAAVLYDMQYEIIGALAFGVFVLLGVCIRLYSKSKHRDVEYLDHRIGENRLMITALDNKLIKQQDQIHDYQGNVIRLEASMRKNETAIKQIKEDTQHCAINTDAKLVEVTDRMNDVAKQLTEIVSALKDHLNIK